MPAGGQELHRRPAQLRARGGAGAGLRAPGEHGDRGRRHGTPRSRTGARPRRDAAGAQDRRRAGRGRGRPRHRDRRRDPRGGRRADHRHGARRLHHPRLTQGEQDPRRHGRTGPRHPQRTRRGAGAVRWRARGDGRGRRQADAGPARGPRRGTAQQPRRPVGYRDGGARAGADDVAGGGAHRASRRSGRDDDLARYARLLDLAAAPWATATRSVFAPPSTSPAGPAAARSPRRRCCRCRTG